MFDRDVEENGEDEWQEYLAERDDILQTDANGKPAINRERFPVEVY